MILDRQKSKPGSVVQRFGDWRKNQPTVLLDNQKWLNLGKPNWVQVIYPVFDDKLSAVSEEK